MIAATFSIHDEEPRVLATVSAPHHWLIRLWIVGTDADGGEIKDRREIRTRRCRLTDALPTAAEQIEEMMAGLVELADGGFQVVKLR